MEISMMVVVAVFTATILIGQHYFPWRRLLGKDLPRVAAYVMGVLAMLVPLTLLFLVWGWMQGAQALHLYGWAVAAMWLVAVSGGAAVMACYLVDGWLDLRSQAKAARREGAKLRGLLNEDELWRD